MDIEIQAQHVDLLPDWRTLIDERLARLAARHPDLMRVHVTLRHGGHHAHGVEEVAVVAACRGATLRAAKTGEDMRAALHATLDALEHELAGRSATRRHAKKPLGGRAGLQSPSPSPAR